MPEPMADKSEPPGYAYQDAEMTCAHRYLLPALTKELQRLALPPDRMKIFDLGCGNGATAAYLAKRGYAVAGVDPPEEGIQQANRHYPDLTLRVGSAYDDLASTYGQFPVLLSLEVVEHVYFPRKFANCAYHLLQPGGTAIISTPYHGYWKNLALALAGAMDAYFTALWNHGHIKFWSIKTLSELLREQGFRDIRFARVGRIAPLAMSMIAIARK